MSHLHRELAPISERAWAEIDREATRTLQNFLAARQMVDFSGPHGWEQSAEAAGRVEAVPGPIDGIEAGVRTSLPLVEFRQPFTVSRPDLDDIERGRPDPDLSGVRRAAQQAAIAEDRTIFCGFKDAHITGIAEASPHPQLEIGENYTEYPGVIARAVSILRSAGIDGPYAAALGPRCWTGVIETTEYGGYPVLEHLRLILGGPVVWSPAIDGAVVLSIRGDDFEICSGQDFSIGYLTHDAATVDLYIEESFGFRVLTPEAAVPMLHG